jgi:hypothetical protein
MVSVAASVIGLRHPARGGQVLVLDASIWFFMIGQTMLLIGSVADAAASGKRSGSVLDVELLRAVHGHGSEVRGVGAKHRRCRGPALPLGHAPGSREPQQASRPSSELSRDCRRRAVHRAQGLTPRV